MSSATARSSVKEPPLVRVEKDGGFYATEVRVNVDKRIVTMLLKEEHPKARTICDQVASQLELPKDIARYFSLWITGKDLELQIRPNLDLYKMIGDWPKYLEKYTHNVPTGASDDLFKLEYRREAMLDRKTERKITNVKALQLLSDEARSKVVNGKYICNVDDIVALGGIYLQAMYGDSARSEGFISDNLADFVPPKLIKSIKPAEWERRIIAEHVKHAGKSELISRMLYLQYARQWALYGCTFFPACKNVPPNGFFEKRTDHLNIAVSAEGLYLIDVDKNKVTGEYNYYTTAWENTADTFTFETSSGGDNNNDSSKNNGDDDNHGENEIMVITPQAPLVDSLASRAVTLLERNETKLEGVRNMQASASDNV